MEFFFCETCGKRVTSADLEAGRAKNKQAKGIFCDDCAKGVMTIAFEPITTHDANKILEQDAASRATPSVGKQTLTRRRTTSQINIPILKRPASNPSSRTMTAAAASTARERDQRPSPKDARPPAGTPSSTAWMVGSVIVAVMLSVIAIVGITSSSSDSTPRKNVDIMPVAKAPVVPAPPALPAGESRKPLSLPAGSAPLGPPTPETAPVAEVKTSEIGAKSADPENKSPDPAANPAAPETPVQPAQSVQPVAPAPPAAPAQKPEPARDDPAAKVLRETASLLAGRRPPAGVDPAAARVRDSQELPADTREALAHAIGALREEDRAVLAGIAAQAGRQVKFATAKETVSGKLVAAEPPVFKVERAIVINGEPRGTRTSDVAEADLTEASRRSFLSDAPVPADLWAGRFLRAMNAGRTEDAAEAMKSLEKHPLKEIFAAEYKRMASVQRERQAREAWAHLLETASEAATLAKVKQAAAELEAFEKEFAASEFIGTAMIVEERASLGKRLETAALSLDPRVRGLFKGRVVNFDAKALTITLAYDFSVKEQLDDFTNVVWAPPGDHTGLTWKKGQLSTFCKGTSDRLCTLPQFLSSSVNVQIKYSSLRPSVGKRVFFTVGLYSPNAPAQSGRVYCNAENNKVTLLSDGAELKASSECMLEPNEGTFELFSNEKDKAVLVKLNGREAIKHALVIRPEHSGICIGGGWDSGVTLCFLQVSGRLSPEWLKKMLSAQKP